MPTDSRTTFSGTASSVPLTDAWVISLGYPMSDSTPPSDSARANSSVDSANRFAASAPPDSATESIPPKPRIWRAATSCPGWSGRPG